MFFVLIRDQGINKSGFCGLGSGALWWFLMGHGDDCLQDPTVTLLIWQGQNSDMTQLGTCISLLRGYSTLEATYPHGLDLIDLPPQHEILGQNPAGEEPRSWWAL